MATTELEDNDRDRDADSDAGGERDTAGDGAANDQPQGTATDTDVTTDGEAATDTDGGDDEIPEHEHCHESVNPETREAVLDRDGHRCQVCGRYGPRAGGLATLHIHHIERDPDGMDEHDEANLTTVCRPCHVWIHERQTEEDAPVELSEADLSELLPQDIEILRVLADAGPLCASEVASELSLDRSVNAVRERLWVLMGLDNTVDERERQLVDKDVETSEWGLVEQVTHSARAHIPDDPQLLVQRIKDEQIRRALDRGIDRQTVMDVFAVSRRATFYIEKRARAFGFPLDAFSRGGRPIGDVRNTPSASSDETSSDGPEAAVDDAGVAESAGKSEDQQRDDTTIDAHGQDGELESVETWESAPSTSEQGAGSAQADVERHGESADGNGDADVEREAVRDHLQRAIDSLEEVAVAFDAVGESRESNR